MNDNSITSQTSNEGDGSPIDVENLLSTNGIDVCRRSEHSKRNGTDAYSAWWLRHCVFDVTHPKPFIIQLESGTIKYRCEHPECKGKRWLDARAKIESERPAAESTSHNRHGSETHTTVPPTPEVSGESPFSHVERVLLKYCHQPDLQAAYAFYAGVAAHALPGQPVWVMLVAQPGSGKTELLESLDGLSFVHFVDAVTSHTFISGQIAGAKKPGLLQRIGSTGFMIFADFSTVLAMKREDRGNILADMRRIYDGHLKKEFGTETGSENREWRGRITCAVGVTPEGIDRAYAVQQTLGERFAMVRWSRAGGIDAALAAMSQDRERFREELKAEVHALLKPILMRLIELNEIVEPALPFNVRRKIAAIGEFAVRARTHVPRIWNSKEIVSDIEAESATRLPQQLAQLAKGAAHLEGRSVVSESDYALVRRVAMDCMPPTRRKVIEGLLTGVPPNMPASSLKYAKEELATVGLIDAELGTFTDLAVDLLKEAGLM